MKTLKLKNPEPKSFQDIRWFVGYVPREIEMLAKSNNMPCFCYLSTTPIESNIYFHQITKLYA